LFASAKLWLTTRRIYGCPWISICAKNHLFIGTFYQFLFEKIIYIWFLFSLFSWIVPNLTKLHHDLVYLIGSLTSRPSMQLEVVNTTGDKGFF
jgi:hypothetical protein